MLRHLRWRVPLVGGIIGLFIGGMLFAVMIYLSPREYLSNAVVEIKPPMSILRREGERPFDSGRFLREEMAKFTSTEVLSRVVDELDLIGRWDVKGDQAIQKLREDTEVVQIKSTDLFSISVTMTNKQDARDVLDALIRSYRDVRRRVEIERSDAALKELEAAVKNQEAVVEEGRKRLKALTEKILPPDADGPKPDINLKEEIEIDLNLEVEMKNRLIVEKVTRTMDESPLVLHDNLPVYTSSPRWHRKPSWIIAASAGLFMIGSIPLMGWRAARERVQQQI